MEILRSGIPRSYLNSTDNTLSGGAVKVPSDAMAKAYADSVAAGTYNPAPADHAYSGKTLTGTAGENLVLGDVCYLKAADSKYWKAVGTATTTMPGIVIATATILANASGTFLKEGYIRDDTWGALTVGGLLYVSRTTAGLATHTAPSTVGDQVQVIGFAQATKIIAFFPDTTLVEVGTGTTTVRIPHTFSMLDAVDARTFPGFYVSLPAGQTAALVACRYIIGGGTSIDAKLTKNGVDALGFTGITVDTTADSTNPADVALADNDFIQLVTSNAVGSPTDLSFTAFIEYTF